MASEFGLGDDFESGFGDESLDNSVFGSESSSENTESVQNDGDGKKKKRKAGIILLVVGFAFLMIASALIGNSRKKSETQGNSKIEEKNEQQTSNNGKEQTGSSGAEVVVVDNGWTKINDMTIEVSDKIAGTFTITDIQYFAKQTGATDVKLELTAKAVGAISGLSGSYTLNIPWRVASMLKLGDKVDIYYYISEVNGNRVVVDISYEK